MHITKIEPIVLSSKLSKKFFFSQWHYESRTICIVKVTTDEGIVGWGEGYGPANIIKSAIEFFAPFVLHQNPLENENIWQEMHRRSLDFARRGIMLSAISAIDNAIWDLKGKILNQPVSVLLGGRKRESVPVYASAMYFTESGDLTRTLVEEAVMLKETGFKAMKMKVGLGVEQDLKNIEAIRKAIGPEVKLMMDANHAYNYREAVHLARQAEQFNVFWFEEPLSPEEYDKYYELRQNTTIPIATGECEFLREGFLTLLKNKSADILQPDLGAAGGLTEGKKIASLANAYGVEVIPHCWGTGIAIATALQFLSNVDIRPGRMFAPEPFLELDRSENGLREELVTPAFKVKDGRIEIPNKPGLGIEINEDALRKYAMS